MDEQVRVKFGPLDDQDMPLSWAEKMLTRMRETNPNGFGKLLAAIVIGAEK